MRWSRKIFFGKIEIRRVIWSLFLAVLFMYTQRNRIIYNDIHVSTKIQLFGLFYCIFNVIFCELVFYSVLCFLKSYKPGFCIATTYLTS